MIIDDNYIVSYINNLKNINKRICKNSFSNEVINYLTNRYDDSESISETLYRILNNINIRPICKCGGYLTFNSLTKGFYKHCSISCAQSDPDVIKKVKDTCIKKYGSKNNINKIKQTNFKKYGVEFVLQKQEFIDKAKNTCLKKYGNENFRNINKAKNTCLKKYNTEYYLNSEDCKQKTIKKFGVDNYRKTNECKEKISKYIKEHYNEIQHKKRKTYLEHYGVDNPMKVQEIKNKFNWKQIKQKEYITKKQNNSFNKSTTEDNTYIKLKENFNNIKRNYKSDVYPFACDFYINDLDLYIECNYHWTHGNKPYEGTEQDNIILQMWKNKNTEFYNNAINTWTIRDPKKRKIAKENKLNYIEFFTFSEFNDWLNKLDK